MLAKELHLTEQAISSWEAGNVEPDPRTVIRAERALKLPAGRLSRPFGYVRPGKATVDVEQAIDEDQALSPHDRGTLLSLYRFLAGGGQ